MMNPFTLKNYIGAEYFCNREEETARLRSAIKNQRNLTLSSLRKMGKTGLIHHSFQQMKRTDDIDTIYFDIYFTESLSGFIDKFGTAVLSEESTVSERIKRKIKSFIRSVRPTISFDTFSGAPSFSFNIASESDGVRTLEEIFAFLHERSQDKNIAIAIDEFQQITSYPENNVEALLRTNIQMLNNVSFVFSGSDNTLISNIFTNAKRPFYQSTELMHLDKIDKEKYSAFITDHFKSGSRIIEDDAVKMIFKLTRRHTYYVQYLCNRLYGNGSKHIDIELVKTTISDILSENEHYYSEYKDLITQQQWNLMKALSKEEGISSVTKAVFLKKHELSNPSTVRRGIKSLLNKNMIFKKKSKYYVYDVFFANWLKNHN